ncbi:Sodium/hydrogen exchanger family-domain-containing protein [Coniella lustricola]|uniref:Sodium/hydrogen exchanger family-domain-containing protein n=1 Tax=Coniella lustricola TaxID=2025994 RepID=A0A2T3AJ12_9PEZI|nr:Sodium/hydrogen exchanger family-domain-containing protein [Coniella lustricola]
MPTLAVNNFNIVVSVLGGWISLFGLVSYLCKENFYLSEALISLLAGVAFSPHAANFIRPLEYAGSQANLDSIILYFSRLVLGVQLVLAGVQLPSRYLKKQWRPLSLLLGPIMTCMWLTTALLIWALVPHLPFLHALAIGSCVTPTDPVLSNVIVKGKFADHNVPKDLQRIIIAESGANDGLGYPFLFLALYLIKYVGSGDGASQVAEGGAGAAMGLWFGETWGYTILLSIVYGATIGWIAQELLHWAEERKFIDRESFLVFAFSLALFITGTCGMIGSDDVLACFIAGNTFTWDDWFRLETLDDSLQPTIDMLLNVSIFMWYGAVCPWHKFLDNSVIPLPRLVALGILVLLVRRLPWVFAIHKKIPQIEQMRQAIFVGFFGPVGVSAIFYLYITLEFVDTLTAADGSGDLRSDVAQLPEAVLVIVWFLCICSVIVHGLSIPLGKLGYYLPQSLSRGVSEEPDTSGGRPPFHIGSRTNTIAGLRLPFSRRNSEERPRTETDSDAVADTAGANTSADAYPLGSGSSSRATSRRAMWRIGGSVIKEDKNLATQPQGRQQPQSESGGNSSSDAAAAQSGNVSGGGGGGGSGETAGPGPQRTIRFPDETSA